ncbi:MAG TPA: methyl-accepting chemotaxis protein [Acidimicrobiales bacterium]|nr:methyl-accepting chemotaxis protein [Acidimicrobiales bacterium]
MLAVSLPVAVVLSWVLTARSADNITRLTEEAGTAVAVAHADELTGWMNERRGDMRVVATLLRGRVGDRTAGELLTTVADTYGSYDAIYLTDLSGRVVASTGGATAPIDLLAQSWFTSAASGQPAVASPVPVQDTIVWPVAHPVTGADGRPAGVVIGDLKASMLAELIDKEDASVDSELLAVDRERRLVYSSTMGAITADADLLTKGAFSTRVSTVGANRGLAGETGSADYRNYRGTRVLAGFAPVEPLGWAVISTEARSTALAPVATGRRLALGMVVVATLAALAFAVWFARRTTRPILDLSDTADNVRDGRLDSRVEPGGSEEVNRLGQSFNSMVESLERLVSEVRSASLEVNSAASELSASSEELAATTTEQAAAVTETSATTEELARASASIADTVDEVASQAAETRDSLEQAQTDMEASSERTLALAERVNEITLILGLINDIADQTNLLALNAAIEAARAGEEGRGFAVVAEEVRRLAERSKASAGDITTIIEGVQSETNATVMAMEKGAKQMQRGLGLLEHVADATAQVRLTTQQQRSATAQVVETMEQLTDASGQVSATASQIAAAASTLASLASGLESTAARAAAAQG